MMKLNKYATGATAAALMSIFSATSSAVVIDASSNNPYSFSWDFLANGNHLTGFGSMTVSGFNSNSLNIIVELTNTSDPGQGGERLTGFAFGIDPNATNVQLIDAADGGMVDATLTDKLGSVKNVEICAFGGQNCQGGSNGGIFGGTDDVFGLVLTGIWGNSVNVDPVAFKYQTGYGSFEFTTGGGCSPTDPNCGGKPPRQVPEPESLALLGLGLLSLVAVRRRKA